MYGYMSNSGKVTTYNNEYWCDTEADVSSIVKDNVAPGSIVIVIETGNAYMLNSKKEWKPI